MRINNPKSFAGFGIANNEVIDNAYQLVNQGQLDNVERLSYMKFMQKLVGEGKDINNAENYGTHGYAWLGEDGKIDDRFIPTLAITDIFTVTQSELQHIENDSGLSGQADVINKLQYWIKGIKLDEEYENYEKIKKGDIIVVTAGEGETVNASYCGAWIITNIVKPGEEGYEDRVKGMNFKIAKISYESGNIVSVNGQVADAAGILHLKLEDVVKESNPNNPRNVADALIKIRVYDLSGSTKFGWVPQSDSFETGDTIAPEATFAFLSEVNAEKDAREAADAEILSILATANDNIATLSGVVGKPSDPVKFDVNESLYSQIKGLREMVNENASALFSTDNAAKGIRDMLDNLKNELFKDATNGVYELVEENIDWTEATRIADGVTTGSNDGRTIFNEWKVVDGGTTTVQTVYKNGSYIWSYDLAANANDKVLAVYDENGNEVVVDVKKDANKNTISIKLDNLEVKNGSSYVPLENGPSLSGKTFKVLIARKLSFTDIDDIAVDTPAYAEDGVKKYFN